MYNNNNDNNNIINKIKIRITSIYLASVQVIALTEELLSTAKLNEISPAAQSPKDNKQELHNQFDHQDKFPVGTRVQAVYSDDGE
ncbi:survival of motor neuron-related-splicing factor 30, partial [Trifolium pratense]